MGLVNGYTTALPPEPSKGPKRILRRGRCQEEEAGTSLPSWMLTELQKPSANHRHRVGKAPLGKFGTRPWSCAWLPAGGLGGKQLASPAGRAEDPSSCTNPQGASCKNPHRRASLGSPDRSWAKELLPTWKGWEGPALLAGLKGDLAAPFFGDASHK